MTADTQDDCRRAFEAWFRKEYNTPHSGFGVKESIVNASYAAWQSAWSSRPSAAGDVVDDEAVRKAILDGLVDDKCYGGTSLLNIYSHGVLHHLKMGGFLRAPHLTGLSQCDIEMIIRKHLWSNDLDERDPKRADIPEALGEEIYNYAQRFASMHPVTPLNVEELVREIEAARKNKALSHQITSSGAVLIYEDDTIALIRKWAEEGK